ncbi:MAG: hypothetical protein ABIA78_03930 [archaeon]
MKGEIGISYSELVNRMKIWRGINEGWTKFFADGGKYETQECPWGRGILKDEGIVTQSKYLGELD